MQNKMVSYRKLVVDGQKHTVHEDLKAMKIVLK